MKKPARKRAVKRAPRKALIDNPRDLWGLERAELGDVSSAAKFAYLVQNEMVNLGLFSSLPEPIKRRMEVLGDEVKLLAEFIDGYAAAVAK